jgi:hypothetical protein
MENKVFLNQEGCVELIFAGDQTPDTITRFLVEVHTVVDTMVADGRPVRILADATHAGKSTPQTRQKIAAAVKEIPYDRIAAYGANTFHKVVGNMITRAVGKEATIKHFTARAEALQWLMN